MDRINIIRVEGEKNPVIIDLAALPDKEVHGKAGEIRKATFWGREISIEIEGKEIKLNRGSVIDFINAHRELCQELKGTEDLDKGRCWGLIGGDGPEEINRRLNIVLNSLTGLESEAAYTTEREQGKSWAFIQGEAAFKAGKYKDACSLLRQANEPEAQYLRGLSFLQQVPSSVSNKTQQFEKKMTLNMAKRSFNDASNQGHLDATLQLATLYKEQGDETNDRNEKAQAHGLAGSYYEWAAHLGSAEASDILAKAYNSLSLVTPINQSTAESDFKRQFMRRRADLLAKNVKMDFNEGKKAFKEKDYASAIVHFESLVYYKHKLEETNPSAFKEASYYLGLSYLEFVKDQELDDDQKNYLKKHANLHLTKAADLGHIEAKKALES